MIRKTRAPSVAIVSRQQRIQFLLDLCMALGVHARDEIFEIARFGQKLANPHRHGDSARRRASHTPKLAPSSAEKIDLTSFAGAITKPHMFFERCVGSAAITAISRERKIPSGATTGAMSMGGESVDRLMDIILQMRINMAHINAALQQQTFEICQELAGVIENQKKSLDDHLNAIDAKLKECSAHIDDYRRLYASLAQVQTKLVQLGAATSCLPAPLPSESTESVLLWRVNELKEQGRL
jgi:hypothetical protein